MDTAVRGYSNRIALIDAYYHGIRLRPNDARSMIDCAMLLSIAAGITATSPYSSQDNNLQSAAGLYRQAERLLDKAVMLAGSQDIRYEAGREERRIKALGRIIDSAIAFPSDRCNLRIPDPGIKESLEAAETAEIMIAKLLHDIDLKDAAIKSLRGGGAETAEVAHGEQGVSTGKTAAVYGTLAFLVVASIGFLYMGVMNLANESQLQERQDYIMRDQAHYISFDKHLWTVKGLSGDIEAEFRVVITDYGCIPKIYRQDISLPVLQEAERDACYAETLRQVQ